MLFSLFLTQNQLTAQQNCDYDYTLRCPPKFQGCLTESTNSANTGFPSIIRSGILCDSVQYSYTDQITLNNDCNNLFDRLWSATIPGSNTTRKCSQKIELFDNTPPQLMSCPPDVTLSLPDSIHTWINPEVSDNCDSVALTSNIASGTSFPLGITQVVFTVTDGCGNTNNCSFTITIEEGCTTEFELICPSDYRGCVGDDIDPSIIGSGNTTHMGDFCGSKSIGHIDSIMTDSICNTFIERTWFATASETDETKTCIQRIELIDSDAPIINNCPPDVTIDNPNTALNWLDPQVNDNCGQVQLISNYNSGAVFSEGQTEVIYSATDECGNESSCSFFVNVIVDTCDQNFTILCPPNFYACLGDSIDPYDTGQANVSHSGDFCGSLNISFQDSVISSFPTKHIVQRLWNATELGDGFTKKCAQIITLEDSQAPTIHNCPKDVTLDSDASSYTWTLPTASDNCTSVTLENSHDNGSTFPEGVTTVTYIASDDNGNSSSCSFDITVKRDDCTDNFEILCPTDYWGCRGESTDPKDTGRPNISHTGNLCGGVGITSEDKIISDSDCSLIIEREWTATLQNGALRKCIQKIRLEDNEAPSIYNCPHDVTLDINNSNYTWDLPTASDNCSTVTIESSHPNGSTFPLGVTKVVYTATDDCGNSSTCSFEITVKSEHTGSDLIIECPDDIILECGQDIHYDS